MYNEIDLHNLDFRLALSIFKRKYNEALKRKDKREILIIHGYGANKLGHIPILATNLRIFLSKNKGSERLAKRLARKAGGKPLGLPCSRTLCFPANPSRFFTREKTAFFFL